MAAFFDNTIGIEVMKFLIENGAQIEAKNSLGKTPLHEAVRGGLFGNVEFLVENGAQIGKTHVNQASGNIKKILMEKEIQQNEKASKTDIPEIIVSNKNPCVICLGPKNEFYVLMPCMHSSLCETCCNEITKPARPQCPSCRQPIERISKIFFQ